MLNIIYVWEKCIYFIDRLGRKAFLFYTILLLALFVRVVNLNYNTAFNDEAIYIVIGRMGLFAHDWWSYGAKLWMAGLPFIYPPAAALATEIGGLSGARLLNVFFGVLLIEETYRFTKLINIYDKKTNETAALIAAFFVAFSGIGIFVSKLATYDMPSFLFLFIGINSFLKARGSVNGMYYFLAFVFIFIAFLTKIVIAIFFPILFAISYLIYRKMSSAEKKRMLNYLYMPFILAIGLYAFSYRDILATYISTHRNLGLAESYFPILALIWQETQVLLLLALPNVFIQATSKRWKQVAALCVMALAIPVFHLVFLRLATLDKHLYLTVIFLSVIVGYGISYALSFGGQYQTKILKVALPAIAAFYLLVSWSVVTLHENEWRNSSGVQAYLRENVKPGDKILTEEGGAVILALYDSIFPPRNITTFDWINYSGVTSDKGYALAIQDRYFDFIEINGRFENRGDLRLGIKKNMGSNYSLVYKSGKAEIYEKKENR